MRLWRSLMNAKEVHDLSKEVRSYLNNRAEDFSDEELERCIIRRIYSSDSFAYRDIDENRALFDRVFNSLRSDTGILKPYLDDDSVIEIMVNGINDVFIEKNNQMILTEEKFYSDYELEEMIRRIAGSVRREFNELNPILDARLADGSRVNAVYKNIALNGPTLTIRKFPKEALTIEKLIEYGTITEEASEFLKVLVEAGFNIFISGGTSSGKTTFLNCLTDFIPKDERIVVIEDSAELQVKNHENLVRLECRKGNLSGTGAITMTDLIKTSLRMRPSRIIVGEVRGAEVADMISACNTGHDGSLSTGHGNSIDGMLKRLESMYLMAVDFPISSIRAQIAEGIDVIVHLKRMRDGSRKVVEIAEICGTRGDEFDINRLFEYSPESGLIKTGNEIKNRHKLELMGY